MCIVMGADTATIPSLRQAPDVNCNAAAAQDQTSIQCIFSVDICFLILFQHWFKAQLFSNLSDYLLSLLNSTTLLIITFLGTAVNKGFGAIRACVGMLQAVDRYAASAMVARP